MTLSELKKLTMYRRFFVLAIAAGCALAASNAVAAPEHIRGTIAGVSGDTLSVDTRLAKYRSRSLTAPGT
jgi:hypothetical protein